MHIYFITEAGINIGFGHLSRCISLAEAFTDVKCNCSFILNSDDKFEKHLKPFQVYFYNWITNQTRLYKDLEHADFCVVDSYLAPVDLYHQIRSCVDDALYFDDYNRLSYPPGYLLNGMLEAETLNYPHNDNIIYLLGPKYQTLRRSFWDITNSHNKSVKNEILISFGGEDPRNLSLPILKLLNRTYPEFHKTLVIGQSYQSMDGILGHSYKNTRIIRNADAEAMKSIMRDSCLAITAGGQVLFELARLGIPPIVIGVAENQRKSIESWSRAGFIDFAGWWNDPSLLNNVVSCLDNNLTNTDMIEKKRSIGAKIIDGKGAMRIVREVTKFEISPSEF